MMNMKRYRLFESWHNGCDNAENEVFAESDSRQNLEEILTALHGRFLHKGLGDGYSDRIPNFRITEDGLHRYWLGDPEESLPEFCRNFRIVEVDEEHPKWDFTEEEELPDTAGYNSMGLLTNGRFSFPFHILADEEGQRERCHVYDSLLMRPEDEICAYDWTDENDEKVINALNRDGDDRSKAAATLTGLW